MPETTFFTASQALQRIQGHIREGSLLEEFISFIFSYLGNVLPEAQGVERGKERVGRGERRGAGEFSET